jgi:hypothetical protein
MRAAQEWRGYNSAKGFLATRGYILRMSRVKRSGSAAYSTSDSVFSVCRVSGPGAIPSAHLDAARRTPPCTRTGPDLAYSVGLGRADRPATNKGTSQNRPDREAGGAPDYPKNRWPDGLDRLTRHSRFQCRSAPQNVTEFCSVLVGGRDQERGGRNESAVMEGGNNDQVWDATTSYNSAPPGNRTPNLRIKSPLLCQLS